MHKIIRADERHRKDINRLIRQTKIGSGLRKDEPVKNFWLVKSGDRIVACAGLEFYNNSAIFTTLAVQKEYRRQGIGTALIDHRLKVARQGDTDTVAFVTMYYHFNFYKRRGFRTCPRAHLPEKLQTYPMFMAKRYKKCAVMVRNI